MLRRLPYGANFLASDDSPELFASVEDHVLFRYSAEAPSVSDRLEQFVKERFGVGGALSCPNGTQALRLAILATRPTSGSRVYIPAVTFIAVAGAVLSLGLIPVCVDVDNRLALDPDLLPDDASRVIVAHMDGMISPVPEGIPYLIEDSAQAMGGLHADGRPVGTTGFAGTFSFHHAKILTSGEGGLIVTARREDRELMRSYSDHGSVREQGTYPAWQDGAFFGENLTSNEAVAAIQLQQFRLLDHILARLAEHDRLTRAALMALPGIRVIDRTPGDPKVSVHLEFETAAARDDATRALDAAGLPSWTLDKYLLPRHPVMVSRASLFADGHPWNLDPDVEHLSRDGFAGTASRLERRLALPLAPELGIEEQERMSEAFAATLRGEA